MNESNNETGVLVVHGIGAQEPGETLNKLLDGLRRVQPETIPDDYQQGECASVGNQPVRFYEVYWADLLKGEKVAGSFQMEELQSLAWFPWLNYRHANYAKGNYSIFTIIGWTVFLPVLNFFMLFAYHGVKLFAQIFSDIGRKQQRNEAQAGNRFQKIFKKATERPNQYTKFDEVMDDFLGDIFNYVNSANGAFYRDGNEPQVPEDIKRVYPQIVQRFYVQLIQALADGCKDIQVVAHSLGTVVSFHALSGLLLDWQQYPYRDQIQLARTRVKHLYTIGSPLEKIQFFWPQLTIGDSPLGGLEMRWDNFVSRFDPVAGVLKRYDQWGKVNNHHLLGGGFVRGHVVYEHSPVFIAGLTQGLCGQVMQVQRSTREKWQDRLILLGETLLTPIAILVAVVAGMALFAITVLLLPYLVSWILQLFFPENIWMPIREYSALFFAIMFVFLFAINPVIRASQVHRLFWRLKNDKPE